MKRLALSLVFLSVIATSLVSGDAPAAPGPGLDAQKAARVKAAYLLNFARYTQWPDTAFELHEDPIVIVQVGECGVGDELAELVRRSEPINGHPLLLRRTGYPDEPGQEEEFLRALARSHLVFVCSLAPERVQFILEHMSGSTVLTVGDTPGFCGNGGMLGFVLQEDRILFEANPKAIQGSPITVSAKVLKLAQIVGDGASR